MIKFINSFARKEDDSPYLTFQKRLLAIVSLFLVVCGFGWTGMFYAIHGASIPFYAAAAYAINAVLSIIISHKTKNHLILVYSIFYATTLSPLIAQWSMGNLHDSGLVLIWGFMTPLGILIFTSLRSAIFSMLFFTACILVTVIFVPDLPGRELDASENIIKIMYSLNIIVSFTITFATCAWFVHSIKQEKKISDDLMENILPAAIIEEMKNTGKTKAKAFTMVTVMFTDFKGFTDVSQRVSAELLVDEIHHCFSEFDRIIAKYKIEKIKTIGDAYLCASGLPISNYTHAVDMINAAFEIRNFMSTRKAEKLAMGEIPFELRIGLHTGPVVAGIVGVRKFQYDIWGDTVNTAARMETNSEISKINISQSTYELLKDKPDLTFESRGKIEAKGKGLLEMFFVEKVQEG